MSRCFAWLNKPKKKEDELSSVLINGNSSFDKTKSGPAAAPPLTTAPVGEADTFPEQQGADITVSPIRTVGSHLLPPPPKRDLDGPKRTCRKEEVYDSDDENNANRELQRTPEADEVGFQTSDFVTRVPITRQLSDGSLSITDSTEVMGVSAVMVTADDPYTNSSRPGLGGAMGTSRTAKSSIYGGGRSLFDDNPQHKSAPPGERSPGIADDEIYVSLKEGKGKMGDDSNKSCGPSSHGDARSVRSGAASSNWFGGSRERSKGFSRSASNRSTRSKSRDGNAADVLVAGSEDRPQETMRRANRGDPDLHHSRTLETSSRRSKHVSQEHEDAPGTPRSGGDFVQAVQSSRGRAGEMEGLPRHGSAEAEVQAPPRTPRDKDQARRSRESNSSPKHDKHEHEVKAPVRESKRSSSRDPGRDKHKRDKSRGRGDDQPRTPRDKSRGRGDDDGPRTPRRGRSHEAVNGVEAAQPSRSRSRGATKQEVRDPDPRERQMRQEEQEAPHVRGEDIARVSSSGGKIRRSQSASRNEDGSREEKKVSSAVQHGLKSSYLAKWPFESRHPDELSFQAGSMLYPLAYAEDAGWLWMSLTRKSFRRGVSRGNVGHGEGLVPITHLIDGDSIPKENWAQQTTPAGMKAVAIPAPATRTHTAAATKESQQKDVELIPALQQRELVRTVPPEINTVSKTLGQWKAIEAQAAMERSGEANKDASRSCSTEDKHMSQLRPVEQSPEQQKR